LFFCSLSLSLSALFGDITELRDSWRSSEIGSEIVSDVELIKLTESYTWVIELLTPLRLYMLYIPWMINTVVVMINSSKIRLDRPVSDLIFMLLANPVTVGYFHGVLQSFWVFSLSK